MTLLTNRLHSDETAVSDIEAIKSVIAEETRAFKVGDFEAWKTCWVQNEMTQEVYVSENAGLCVLRGWEQVHKHMEHVFANDLRCLKTHFEQFNMTVNKDDQSAWVTFDGTATNMDGTLTETYETRVVHLTELGWKIAYSNVIVRRGEFSNGPSLAVDGNGQIIWATEAARSMLKTHPVFSISAGKIRANRLPWDKILQSALRNASQYHGHFEMTRYVEENGGPFRCPVVLGETDEGVVAVVCLSVRDSATYLQFDLDGIVDRKLSTAQSVFGLSDGQINVARHVSRGQGLKDIAEELEISVNTVRTHLSRIYEKTGVNSQTALVRLLLSVT
jgi:DNA-binding CsgD family transcriptional regulator